MDWNEIYTYRSIILFLALLPIIVALAYTFFYSDLYARGKEDGIELGKILKETEIRNYNKEKCKSYICIKCNEGVDSILDITNCLYCGEKYEQK